MAGERVFQMVGVATAKLWESFRILIDEELSELLLWLFYW